LSNFKPCSNNGDFRSLFSTIINEGIHELIAANQTGTHPHGRKSYGHSMIIDPWGKVLNCLNEGAGIIIDELDINFLQDVRSNVPIHAHRRL
jgi:nitrilase